MDDQLRRMLMQIMEGQTEIKLELKSVNEKISKVEVKLEIQDKVIKNIKAIK